MKKSKLSITALTCGIVTTSLAVILLPLGFIANGTIGTAFIGFVAIAMFLSGFVGTVCAATKLLIGNETLIGSETDMSMLIDEENKSIAIKGLLFSFIPSAFWMFLLIIGTIMSK